mgnify:CR=1 FL=1
MGPATFFSASVMFQTRSIHEWMDDDGPASRANVEPAAPPREIGTRPDPDQDRPRAA